MKRLIFAFAALLCVVLHGCSKQTKSERLSWVGVRFGQLPAMVGESNYKIKQREGKPFKSFEVQLERGKPGESLPITLDGVEVGQITLNEDGEGELEYSDEIGAKKPHPPLPPNFPVPKHGSVLKIGNAYEVVLQEITDPQKK